MNRILSNNSTTAPRRPRRLLDEDEDLVEDVVSEAVGNYTQDNIDNPDPFDNTLDDSYNDIDYNINNLDTELQAAEATHVEDGQQDNINGVLEGDDISVLSISSTQVLRRQQKRPLMDTESQASSKRRRAMDRRKKQPTLDPPSSPEVTKRLFLSSFEQATTKKSTGKILSVI
jgi:hypothetical protein